MDKIIKKFIEGKYVLKVNNNYELNSLFTFAKKNSIALKIIYTDNFPKYFYINYNTLVLISRGNIISFRWNRIMFSENIKIISSQYKPEETVLLRPVINMDTYIKSFNEKITNDNISLWRKIVDRFKLYIVNKINT